MTYSLKQAINWGGLVLRAHHISSWACEAIDLMSHIVGKSKEIILAHEEKTIGTRQWKRYQLIIHKRARGIPFAYCVGWTPFARLRIAVGDGGFAYVYDFAAVLCEQWLAAGVGWSGITRCAAVGRVC